MKKQLLTLISITILASLVLSACGSFASLTGTPTSQLKASGTISTRSVDISPEISGKAISINVGEGASVKKGDELFRVDDSILKAQRDLAQATLDATQAQYDLVLSGARLQDQQNRVTGWSATQPSEFDQPVWYFEKGEKLASAQIEKEAADADLTKEKANSEKVRADAASQEFLTAETRVSNARTAFLIADQVLTQANEAQSNTDLKNFAQQQYDAALNELNSAQTDYSRLLTAQGAKDVLEARARVKVAQERYDRAIDYYNSLLNGDQSLQVEAAAAAVKQAEAALVTLDIQLKKTVVYSPMDGVILSQNVEPGETLAAGGVVMVIGQLEDVELNVYIPETDYGKVQLGQQVSITVDSFPSETFSGEVVQIADQAEFTPRNVQTVEGRRATVYAVKLRVPNADLRLKPGMPADVTFEPAK
jgi:HlyD family secretion protein